MLELAHGLDAAALEAIADLERRVIAADGGRLKLGWGHLRSRGGDLAEDLLWWDDGRLVGFLGIYAFAAPVVELTGMVDPDARRQGIATALLDAALPLCRERGHTTALLITPRTCGAARELAIARGAVLEHSEHVLRLLGAPAEGPELPGLSLRPMIRDDAPAVAGLLATGFGWHPPAGGDVADLLSRGGGDILVGQLDGLPIATLRLSRDGSTAAVHGFVVHPGHRGRGIGRDLLRRACRQAGAGGATQVDLEVAVDNERALHLYTSLGFAPVITEDYYRLPL